MKYRNIWLDADGTLLDFKRSEAEAIRETMSHYGVIPTDEKVNAYSKINDSMWKMLERGEIVKSEMLIRRFEKFSEYLQIVVNTAEMSSFYIHTLSQKGYLLDGAEALCRKLSQTHTLYIVTNGFSKVQNARFLDSPLLPYVKKIFISDEIGYEKPDVRYFQAVAEQIPDFSKESTVIVGDSLSSDIQGGIQFGIDTCWYNPNHLTRREGLTPTYIADDLNAVYTLLANQGGEGNL